MKAEQNKIKVDIDFKDITLIGIGILCAAFGLKGFLLPNQFIDGGATGISLLITEVTDIPLSIIIIIINIPFIILAYRVVGAQFAIKTIFSIIGLSVSLAVLNFPHVTDDKFLVALFGGMFLGAGIGFAVRGGSVLDGTEVLAIFLSKKTGFTIGDIIIIINVFIFGVAIYFLGVEHALYSMITYLAASKTLDFIIEGIDEYIGVTIISNDNDKIKNAIIHEMGRGVTVYQGKKGYASTLADDNASVEILYTVLTRLELNKLQHEIDQIDPKAFIIMHAVKDTRGGMIKKKSSVH